MNDYDRDNLNWLLTASEEEIQAFYSEITTEELLYVLSLLASDLDYKLEALRIEETPDQVEDLSLAKQYLSKFQLNK